MPSAFYAILSVLGALVTCISIGVAGYHLSQTADPVLWWLGVGMQSFTVTILSGVLFQYKETKELNKKIRGSRP